ncbi:MAG: ATP-binding cassette domain-containing protein [Steroidobacteraceae bacterium]
MCCAPTSAISPATSRSRNWSWSSESVSNSRFDKLLAQEEVWIRKGVEARRTRNEGRVLRLEQLRRERAARRERVGRVNLQVDSGERSGKTGRRARGCVVKLWRSHSDRQPLGARDARDRVGLIGPNGAGKSTLIRLILGTQQPDSGTVRLGTNLNIAYFDQMRAALDPEQTVADTISPGSDWVEIAGQRKHISSYLQDFLFSPRRAQSPVRMLSGGERSRLLLARLFARPANLLVLDEPTNDLDIDSLELLEQTLADYPGTVLLVSHDRRFLDNIVTQTIAAEGAGGGANTSGVIRTGWCRRPPPRPRRAAGAPSAFLPPRSAAPGAAAPATRQRSRLGYKEQRELDSLPKEIETLESEQAALLAAHERRAVSRGKRRCHARGQRPRRGHRAGHVRANLPAGSNWREQRLRSAGFGLALDLQLAKVDTHAPAVCPCP